MLINQTLDSDWFRVLAFVGTVAFALSGVVLAYAGQYTLFGALILATLPAVGGGVVRDLMLQRDPLGDRAQSRGAADRVRYGPCRHGGHQDHIARSRRLGGQIPAIARAARPRLIELFDAIGLAAFTVVGVVVVLDTSAQPLWLWGPIAAVITASFGGLMRDLFRHDRVTANLRGELYPEIAAVWGLALAVFLGWEGDRLQPDEIRSA